MKKSVRVQQDAMDERIEIVKYRANHAIVKVKLQMYPEDTSSSFLLAFFFTANFTGYSGLLGEETSRNH